MLGRKSLPFLKLMPSAVNCWIPPLLLLRRLFPPKLSSFSLLLLKSYAFPFFISHMSSISPQPTHITLPVPRYVCDKSRCRHILRHKFPRSRISHLINPARARIDYWLFVFYDSSMWVWEADSFSIRTSGGSALDICACPGRGQETGTSMLCRSDGDSDSREQIKLCREWRKERGMRKEKEEWRKRRRGMEDIWSTPELTFPREM